MTDIIAHAMGWLALSFGVFIFFQTAGVNLAPAWARSRVVLALLVLMSVVGSQAIMV